MGEGILYVMLVNDGNPGNITVGIQDSSGKNLWQAELRTYERGEKMLRGLESGSECYVTFKWPQKNFHNITQGPSRIAFAEPVDYAGNVVSGWQVLGKGVDQRIPVMIP